MSAAEQAPQAQADLVLALLSNLAGHYAVHARLAEAEPLYARLREQVDQRFRPSDPFRLTVQNNVAGFYVLQARYAEAEPLYRQIIPALEAQGHPRAAVVRKNLGVVLFRLGRFAEAERVAALAFEELRRLFGPHDFETMLAAEVLAGVRLANPGAGGDALTRARLVLERTRRLRHVLGRGRVAARLQSEPLGSAARFMLFADALWGSGGADSRSQRSTEAFSVLQEAVASPTDRSINEQVIRHQLQERNPRLAELLRERQRIEDDWRRLDESPDQDPAAATRGGPRAARQARLAALEMRLEDIEARLGAAVPDYVALTRPQPVGLAAAQRLLAPDEAILLVAPSDLGTHVMAVTRDSLEWRRGRWNAARVRKAVQRLRWDAGAEVDGTAEEIDALPATRVGDPASFDRSTAHNLYRELIAPISGELRGKARVYVIAGGALAGLPLSLLVTSPPTGSDDDPAALRATRWFGDEMALIHLPTIQALALLRQAPPVAGDWSSFVGIGNPVLGPASGPRRRRTSQQQVRVGQLVSASPRRDAALIADPNNLRALSSLPGTQVELEAVRRALGAPPSSLIVAERATEQVVRSTNLSAARVLLFATHGFTAHEAAGVGEAGLVLTPPPHAPRDGDDGYLAASEAATLRLNADWVILSACNTAAGDAVDNPGLGPLARAFFYAGARSVLASHWPVSDEVAPVLVTRTLQLERQGVARADALRRAMREIRMKTSHDRSGSWAHPFFWAPFVLIGDGRP